MVASRRRRRAHRRGVRVAFCAGVLAGAVALELAYLTGAATSRTAAALAGSSAVTHTGVTPPRVVESINLACATYGDCATLWRRASCETGGTFDPSAHNPRSGAAGLFQFLPSTWRTTPYARFSIYSAAASALAAGWMQSHGRGAEWACR